MNFNISFKGLEAKRMGLAKQQVNINNNSTITSVFRDEDKMNVGFVFTSSYEPNIGILRIEGEMLIEDTSENIENAIRQWKASEERKLPKDMAEKVHNAILSNCIVEASLLARDVKLPAPMPMPQVNLDKGESDTTSYIR